MNMEMRLSWTEVRDEIRTRILNRTYAPTFADAGFVVLTFDYRGCADSDSRLVMIAGQPDVFDDVISEVAELAEAFEFQVGGEGGRIVRELLDRLEGGFHGGQLVLGLDDHLAGLAHRQNGGSVPNRRGGGVHGGVVCGVSDHAKELDGLLRNTRGEGMRRLRGGPRVPALQRGVNALVA